MLTTFQKAVLATIAGSAILIALVLAARGPAIGATPLIPVGTATTLAVAGGNGGIAPGIVTTGDAVVKVKPDVAILTIGATAQAATAGEAQTLVADRVERILAAARALGIADRDVKTASYHIGPTYAYDRGDSPRITGYQASQQVTVTLRKVEEAGRALDAFVRNDGATDASIFFSLEDPKAAQADARRLAIEDARSKADAMARTAGVSLGKVLSITDQSVSQPYGRHEKVGIGAPAAADTQIPFGDLDIVIHVQVQYAID